MQYVCHVASPFPNDVPKNENEVIKPAVEGTKAVLDACLKHGVKKVIVTSSIAAIFTGRKDKNHFTENDWSDLATSPPYEKSKCLAEQYVWEFYKKHHDKIKITTINPGKL